MDSRTKRYMEKWGLKLVPRTRHNDWHLELQARREEAEVRGDQDAADRIAVQQVKAGCIGL